MIPDCQCEPFRSPLYICRHSNTWHFGKYIMKEPTRPNLPMPHFSSEHHESKEEMCQRMYHEHYGEETV